MKLLSIISLLRNKSKNIYNNKTFNKLFNDYNLMNKKKENMKINYLRNESKLYPFSPKIENGGIISFTNKKNNYQEPFLINNFCRTFYKNDKEPLNQMFFSFNNQNNKNGRNRINENDIFNGDDNNYYFNNFSESDKNNNNYLYYDYFRNNKANPINLKESSYKFHNNKAIISSLHNKNINKQISEYLKNFQLKREKINPINSNYLNYNKELNKNRTKNSKYRFNKESFSNTINYKRENLFNKSNKNEINSRNKNERFNTSIKDIKSKSIFKINNENKIEYKNKNKKINNNRIIYSNSQNYLNNVSKKNNNIKENNQSKNIYSNKSLNPSSLGADQTKTLDSNNRRNSKNNIKSTNALISNLNSASSRINDINKHFLKDLRIISGVNEGFYDINKNYNKNKYNADLSLQSLSDSKIMELANKYANEEDNSSENYKMNNIIHNKKKHKNKK